MGTINSRLEFPLSNHKDSDDSDDDDDLLLGGVRSSLKRRNSNDRVLLMLHSQSYQRHRTLTHGRSMPLIYNKSVHDVDNNSNSNNNNKNENNDNANANPNPNNSDNIHSNNSNTPHPNIATSITNTNNDNNARPLYNYLSSISSRSFFSNQNPTSLRSAFASSAGASRTSSSSRLFINNTPSPQKIITNQTSLLMGPSPPPLYEMALIGHWKEFVSRIKHYPNEALYRDKCDNMTLHLVCRRQPPTDVVYSILKVLIMNLERKEEEEQRKFYHSSNGGSIGGTCSESSSSSYSYNHPTRPGQSTSASTPVTYGSSATVNNSKTEQNQNYIDNVTMDGQTALHFATYCGASPVVVDLLLQYEYHVFMTKHGDKNRRNSSRSSRDSSSTNLNGIMEDDIDTYHVSTNSIELTLMNPTQGRRSPLSCMTPSMTSSTTKSTTASAITAASSSGSSTVTGTATIPTSTSITAPQFKLPVDRRGRTPLHALCAGFRTVDRPTNIHSLLVYDPSSVLLEDEKCKTSLSLMFDDYAEEVKDILNLLQVRNSSEKIETLLFREQGSMNECWKILALLLKAVYLGSVVDNDDDVEEVENYCDSDDSSGGDIDDENKSCSDSSVTMDNEDEGVDEDEGKDEDEEEDEGGNGNEDKGEGEGEDEDNKDSVEDVGNENEIENKDKIDSSSKSKSIKKRSVKKSKDKRSKAKTKQKESIILSDLSLSSTSLNETENKNNNSHTNNIYHDEEEKKHESLSPPTGRSMQSLDKIIEESTPPAGLSRDTTKKASFAPSMSSPLPLSHKYKHQTIARTKSRKMAHSAFFNTNNTTNPFSSFPLSNDTNPMKPSSLSFSLIHAAASIPYSCPYGFFQLLLRVCPSKVSEFDAGCVRHTSSDKDRRSNRKTKKPSRDTIAGVTGNNIEIGALPLHLATKSPPPSPPPIANPSSPSTSTTPGTRLSQSSQLRQEQNLSTTFHGLSSSLYQDPLTGVTISYHSQSKLNNNKQYHTVSFAPSMPTSSSSSSSSSKTKSSSSKYWSTNWNSNASNSNTSLGIPMPIVSHLIDVYPKAASIPEPSSGKYPLELAIESGKSYHWVISPLIDAFPPLIFPTKHVDSNDINGITIDRIYSSLSSALMNSSAYIRNEAAITTGCLIKRMSGYIDRTTNKIDENLAPTFAVDAGTYKVEEFMKTLIKNSYGSMNLGHVNEDPYSNTHFLTCDEWANIQATSLRALSYAFSNASPRIINMRDETPKKALDAAENMIRHEKPDVRESAASVMGSALNWLGEEYLFDLLDRLLLVDYRQKIEQQKENEEHSSDRIRLSGSMHSLFSVGSGSSAKTQQAGNTNLLLRNRRMSMKDEEYKMFKAKSIDLKHGKALACLRILSSKYGGKFASKHQSMLKDISNIIKELMLDDSSIVRQAACLAMGSILGRSIDETAALRAVRHTILKCMRRTEEVEVHIALARGLMVAAHMKPHIFVCKTGTPILEAALILAVSSSLSVQKMFHAFLWLALGIRDKVSAHAGLSSYMSLAEGENGVIMMNLVTKDLARIKAVDDVLWSTQS